jgi:hypothetical protein
MGLVTQYAVASGSARTAVFVRGISLKGIIVTILLSARKGLHADRTRVSRMIMVRSRIRGASSS